MALIKRLLIIIYMKEKIPREPVLKGNLRFVVDGQLTAELRL